MLQTRIEITKELIAKVLNRYYDYDSCDNDLYHIMCYIEFLKNSDQEIRKIWGYTDDSIIKLGYKDIGHLLIKNISITNKFENEFIVLYNIYINFDTEKISATASSKLESLFHRMFGVY